MDRTKLRSPPALARASLAGALFFLSSCAAGEHRTGAANESRLPAWSLGQPTTRIGGLDVPMGAELTRIMQVIPVGRDSVLVRDSKILSVLLFEGDGALVRSIGRAGQGLREFEEISNVSVWRDTLWVTDMRRARLHAFSFDGRIHASHALPESTVVTERTSSTGEVLSRMLQRRVVPGANLVSGLTVGSSAAATLPEGSSIGDAHGAATFVALLDSGRVKTAVAWIPLGSAQGARMLFGVPPTNFHIADADPFPDQPLFSVADDGSSFVLVERPVASVAAGARYKVTKWGPRGERLFQIDVPYQPLDIPASLLDSVVEARAKKLEMSGFASGSTARKLSRDSLRAPRFFPPITSATIGTDGSVWLGREGLTTAVVGARQYDVIDANGSFAGSVVRTRPGRIMAATADAVWVVEYDIDDVPTLLRYPIMR